MRPKKLNNVLFIGTGGGNDVASTPLAMSALWNRGWRWDSCDLGGVISPFHDHTNLERWVGQAYKTSTQSERHLIRHDNKRSIGFVDATVQRMVETEHPFLARQVINFSVAEGTQGITDTLRLLRDEYDFIVLVDLGGDIFFAGERDQHVLSPMFDAIMLRGFVDANVPGILFEAGPGTDGELTPEALRESLTLSQAEAYHLNTRVLKDWYAYHLKWIAPMRAGRTAEITLSAFMSRASELSIPYRARAHLAGMENMYAYHDQRIATDLCRQYFLVDPRKIKNPFAVTCTGPRDWFEQTQFIQATNNEARLEYLRGEDGKVYQFASPSPLFPEEDRFILAERMMHDFLEVGACDALLLMPEDWERLQRNNWHYKVTPRDTGRLIEIHR